jgi:RimJ/RimL family protein N-acetyltransferase
MVIEHDPATLAADRAWRNDPHLAMLAESIAAGNTAARLWTIDAGGESATLLWDRGNNVVYLGGESSGAAMSHALAGLIDGTIRQQSIAAGRRYFKARLLTPALERSLPAIIRAPLQPRLMLFFGYGHESPPEADPPRVDRLMLVAIDRALLADPTIANVEPVREEIGLMWPSQARYESHGFGVAAVHESRIIGWCTAEYVSATRCGIGIETLEVWQGRGVATSLAAAFVREALSRGIKPYWECAADNTGSIRVAEKAGVTRLREEPTWIGLCGA